MPKSPYMDGRVLANARFEEQGQNHFEVQFAGIGGASGTVSDDDIMFSVVGCPIPTRTFNEKEIPYGNGSLWEAGKQTFNSFDLTVRDFMSADISKQFEDWADMIQNPANGKHGSAYDDAARGIKGYKKNALLYEYSPDGNYQRKWVIQGCWPVTLNRGDLSHEGDDKKRMTITFRCDLCYRDGDGVVTGTQGLK